ncbi:MAG: hypothetical protein WCK11_00655 [Candidatus Falkowbacteria bacterium]
MKSSTTGIVIIGVLLASIFYPSHQFLRAEGGFSASNFFINSTNLPQETTDSVELTAELEPNLNKVAELFLHATTTDNLVRLDVIVDPHGQSINLVNAPLTYSSSTLRLVKTDYDSSAFSLFLSNVDTAGSVSFVAMQPAPGINTRTIVTSFYFEVIGQGPALFTVGTDAEVMANDGFGTNILAKSSGAIWE